MDKLQECAKAFERLIDTQSEADRRIQQAANQQQEHHAEEDEDELEL